MKYRVGRKQKRAILDENGIEVGVFKTGSESEAQKYCDFLNGDIYSQDDVLNIIKSIMYGTICSYGNGHHFYDKGGVTGMMPINTTERAKEKLEQYMVCNNRFKGSE